MYQTSVTVGASLDETWEWHTRPGAMRRLTPPWQPVAVRTEASSLRDGAADLTLPGGIRWVATHEPETYEPSRRFVDRLTSWPLAPMLEWRHDHRFAAVDEDHTRVTDHVQTRLPSRMLRPMFAYRQRQLVDDLASHRRATSFRAEPMTVAVTGSSGLVGNALCALLTTGGHRVVRLVRRSPTHADERQWKPSDPEPELLEGIDVLVHLAGEPIAGRFTSAHQAAVRDSRIGPTARLAELAARTAGGGSPVVMVCASGVGFYGPDRGDEVLTEESDRGDDFLAEVVADWENATSAAREAGVRVVNVRTGIVQTPAGGALRVQRPLFEAGLGGRLGDGQQWTAWIGLDDVLDIYLHAMVDTRLVGPVNAVAPAPVRNADYTRTLARVLRRPALLPTPTIGPRLLLGSQGAATLALAGQRVVPQQLSEADHRFRFSTLEPALRHVLGRSS